MRFPMVAAVALAALTSAPAYGQILGEENVALSTTPTIFTLSDASFAFTYDAMLAAQFDPDPYSVQTFGTGETSAFGGFLGIPLEPSVFRQSGIFIDGDLFPSFAAFPELTPISNSLVASDLALRYSSGSDFFYGYARLNGNGTLDFAFESQPNTGITAGAPIVGPLAAPVPEPGTWAMLLVGFAFVGGAMRLSRQKRRLTVNFA